MEKPNIILFGAGSQVRYSIDIIEKENKYNIVGITDPYKRVGEEIFGYKIVGKQEEIKKLIKDYNIQGGIITIGDNWIRKIVYDIIISIIPDFNFVSAIHPSTIKGRGVRIGKGTIIMAGCIISPCAQVGQFCFFATGAILEHDSYMDDFASLSAGSITGGKVQIGKYSAITMGVTLFDRISIGEHSVIGSGAQVAKDISKNVVAYGVPANVT